MLEVIEYGKGEYEFPALVVLGCFDAIHAGHRDLLKKAKLQAKINGLDLGVMMFREGKGGKLVYSFEERCAILEQFNVKFVLAVDFTDEFKQVAPLDFLHEVEDKINVKAYMSGKDFRFGAGAKGKSSTLKNYGEDEENGVWYMPVKDVELNGEKISTTLVKSCLEAGDIAKANELLGSEFTVSGEVVNGEGRGASQVGFPTVNIVYPEWKSPIKHGVYSVKCLIGETDYQGIANFGDCPTFGDERVALEVYLEGFSGDLYGQVLTIRFVDFIRDIEKFNSAEELSGQLENDLNSLSDELAATVDEPVVEEVAEEVVVEEVIVEEQPVEEVTVEEVVVEEQPVEEVTVEEVTEEPVAEEVVAEEVVEEVAPEEIEEATEEQPVEEVVAEEVTEELPVEEEIVPDDMQYSEGEETEEVAVEEQSEELLEEVVEETVEEPTEETPEEVIEEATEEVIEEEPEVITEEVIEEIPEETVEVEEIVEIPEETEDGDGEEN